MKNPETSIERSAIMRKVGRKNTAPEMVLRRELHLRGYRYRLHDKTLPGSPDLVLPKYKTVIFVHGCFWHRHEGCRLASNPKDNAEFWNDKFHTNIQRDIKNENQLKSEGWQVITVWQCELKKKNLKLTIDRLTKRLVIRS